MISAATLHTSCHSMQNRPCINALADQDAADTNKTWDCPINCDNSCRDGILGTWLTRLYVSKCEWLRGTILDVKMVEDIVALYLYCWRLLR